MDVLENHIDKLRELNSSLEQTLYGTNTGGKSHYDLFWDSFQDNGTRTEYVYSFGRGWTDEIFKPKYDLIPTSAYGMFYHCSISNLEECIEKAGIVFDTSNADTSYIFSNSQIKTIPIVSILKGSATYTFQNSLVETIRKLIIKDDGSTTFNNTFGNCWYLKNIEIEGVIGNNISFPQSTSLTKASIEHIISCLSNTTSGKTLTLPKSTINKRFETSSGVQDGSTSEEWLNLVATKPNWTISLS